MDIGTGSYHTSLALARRMIFVTFLAATASGCRHVHAAPGPAAPLLPAMPLGALRPYFIPGETITWSVSLSGVEGGRARLVVGRVANVDGKRMVVARAEAESAGVLALVKKSHDAVSSWIDVETGIPTRTESESGPDKPLIVHAARRDGEPVADFRVWRAQSAGPGEGEPRTQRLPILGTHDPLSAVMALRAWRAPRGGRAVIYSLGGVRLWRTVFTVEARETKKGPLGKRAALRIAGVSTRLKASLEDDASKPPRRFTVWLTDDDQRIPLEIRASTEYGDVVAKATSYDLME
jgi:uncharacterized protein DUF3108